MRECQDEEIEAVSKFVDEKTLGDFVKKIDEMSKIPDQVGAAKALVDAEVSGLVCNPGQISRIGLRQFVKMRTEEEEKKRQTEEALAHQRVRCRSDVILVCVSCTKLRRKPLDGSEKGRGGCRVAS